MLTRADRIILEVKRRLGGVNLPVPDEIDILAYLNGALRGMWNYGAEVNSPLIEDIEFLDVGESGEVTLRKPPIKVSRVVGYVGDADGGRDLPVVMPHSAARPHRTHSGMWGYSIRPLGIKVYMSPDCVGGSVCVSYFPEFMPLEGSEDYMPFGSSLDEVAVLWTVRQIVDGKNMNYADMACALGSPLNSLVQYFESKADECWTGMGPW